jgi:lysophospholipase L1-like esterase
MDIINRGFAGYNTDWGLPILKQLLPTVKEQADDPSKIQLMTIFFGANDSGLPIAKAHVPIERYKDNLTTMVNMIKDTNSEYYNPSIRLVLITPPPVDEVKWKERCENQGDELNRTNENARLYGEVVKQIAREHGIVAIDVWSHFMSLDRHLSEFQVDGLHLNDKGNQVRKGWSHIKELF